MKAMILAAGLGTRLRPLTDNRPKALVEIAGRTLLDITLSRLRAFGISEVIINVHHFADMILDYLKAHDKFGMRIEVSREEVLLDTGGGLKKAAWFFLEDSNSSEEPFLLHNVDVISTIDLQRMVQFQSENHALATLAVQDRETARYLLFDEHLQLCGRRSSGTAIPGCAPQITASQNPSATASPPAQQVSSPVIPNEVRDLLLPRERTALQPAEEASGTAIPGCAQLQALAFSGIHVISPRLLPMITEEGVFSIIPSYLRLAAQGENILAFRADDYYWRDLGTPDNVLQAALDLKQNILF
ncbi:MAG TPA: nucleotidyltransferase family protein [Candidatus Acidoferrum sp.]|nr:nucleotidyltransferase family protein [Candidatus Acidoferrum sp.]